MINHAALLQSARQSLAEVFGFSQFRPPQEEVVSTLLSGQDALVVMPTGGGKSLCYQLPSLVRSGTGIVVSPLIALMQDQVSALSQLGIRAGCLNSSIPLEQLQATEQQLLTGQLDLLYVAPERLLQPRTLNLLQRTEIALLAIDEAHSVSQRGNAFSHAYRQMEKMADQSEIRKDTHRRAKIRCLFSSAVVFRRQSGVTRVAWRLWESSLSDRCDAVVAKPCLHRCRTGGGLEGREA